MVRVFFLVLSITFFQITYCQKLINNLDEDDVSEIVKEIITKYENKELEISRECGEQFVLFWENLKTSDDGMWALKMIDASFKISSGLLTYNFAMLGNFDECLSIEATKTDVKARYCLTIANGTAQTDTKLSRLQGMYKAYKSSIFNSSVTIQDSLAPSAALCLPHKCGSSDIRNILETYITFLSFDIICQTKDDVHKPLDTGAIITLTYFGFFIVVMALSTIYDIFSDKNTNSYPVLKAFSVYTNGRKVFRASKSSEEFSCLHGLRFLSMLWVIMGHVFMFEDTGPLMNINDILQFLKKSSSLVFVNAVYAVDTFLVITGFLVVYSYLRGTHQGKKFNLIKFYSHRYLRLTPSLIGVLLFTTFLLQYLGSGPFYPLIDSNSKPCKKWWWTTLLYVENYVNVDDMCIPESWYLNVDWQLHLIAPAFLLLLPKLPFIGLPLMLAAIIASMVSSYIITWDNGIPALQTNLHGNLDAFTEKYYKATHTRASTWFIGAILGYILARNKYQSNIRFLKMPKWLICLNWMAALAALPACVFAGFDHLNGSEYHPYPNAFYNTFARPAWALSISWIILACVLGHGSFINTFLSWPIFQVLNRFTYSMYLMHVPVYNTIMLTQREPGYYSLFNDAMAFWGLFALCFGVSIFWVLAFESPIPALEKVLWGNDRKPKIKIEIENVTSHESAVGSSSVVTADSWAVP